MAWFGGVFRGRFFVCCVDRRLKRAAAAMIACCPETRGAKGPVLLLGHAQHLGALRRALAVVLLLLLAAASQCRQQHCSARGVALLLPLLLVARRTAARAHATGCAARVTRAPFAQRPATK